MTTASLSPACDSDSCSHASTNSVSPRDITRANLAVRGQGRNKVSSRRKGNIAASPTWGCADKEAWRSDPRAARELGDAAVGHLRSALERPYAIYPRPPSFAKREGFHGLPPSADLPVLTVTPLELFRHILACFAGSSWSSYDREDAESAEPFVEIFGGVAHAVSHTELDSRLQSESDDGCPSSSSSPPPSTSSAPPSTSNSPAHRRPEPTDLDARFYIPCFAATFDSCRAIVEDYLHLKLFQALPADSPLRRSITSSAQLRYLYFQKQAVVGDAFSLLSIGDPASGRNIDMEFAYMANGTRKYFDDANSCVIPLSLTQLAGVERVVALSQTGDYDYMCELMQTRELVVPCPEEVLNGLSLYAHALSEKRQQPTDAETEDEYGQSLCDAFVQQCQRLLDSNQEPTRFIRSFIRSHYAARPIKAVVFLVQILVELSAYAPEVKDWTVALLLCEKLCDLVTDAIQASLHQAAPAGPDSPDMHLTLVSLLAFLNRPGPGHEQDDDNADAVSESSSSSSCASSSSYASSSSSAATLPTQRVRAVRTGGGTTSFLLAKAFAVDTSAAISILSARLRALQCRESTPAWTRVVLAAAVDALGMGQSGQSEGEVLGRMVGGLREVGAYETALQVLRHSGTRARKGAEVKEGARIPREVVAAEAKALLKGCPREMAAEVGAMLTRAVRSKERHRETREAIRVVQARWPGEKGKDGETDRAMLVLLMAIPRSRRREGRAEDAEPRAEA